MAYNYRKKSNNLTVDCYVDCYVGYLFILSICNGGKQGGREPRKALHVLCIDELRRWLLVKRLKEGKKARWKGGAGG